MRARHDAAHLAGTDADRRAVAREDDRIRLYVLADTPREQQVVELLTCRHDLRDNLQILAITLAEIARLCRATRRSRCAARCRAQPGSRRR